MPRRTYLPDPPPTRRRRGPAPPPFRGVPPTHSTFAVPTLPETTKPQAVLDTVPATRATPPKQQVALSSPSQPPRPKVPHWILQVRELDLLDVAQVLGLDVQSDRLRPCPRCNDEAGAEVYTSKKGWTLWRCRVCETRDRGNLDLASYALTGEKAGDLEPGLKELLQQWFVDQGWCDSDGFVEDADDSP